MVTSDEKRFRYFIGCLVMPLVLIALRHDDHHPVISWGTPLMILIGVPAGALTSWVGIKFSEAWRKWRARP